MLTATGSNNELLVPETWDVTAFIGQVAVIEIVDSLTGGWGHINIDEIAFSDPSDIVFRILKALAPLMLLVGQLQETWLEQALPQEPLPGRTL